MLGTGRRRVSLAAADLQNAGLIENMRGTIRVLNRKSLEEAACECYGVIQHFNGGLRLKQPSPHPSPLVAAAPAPPRRLERRPSPPPHQPPDALPFLPPPRHAPLFLDAPVF